LIQQEYERRRENDARNAQISDERVDSLSHEILRRNRDLVEKFLEIAERRVSVLDAYGDEKWDTLPGEILLFMKKLSQRERRVIDWREYSKAQRKIKRDPGIAKTGKQVQLDPVLPTEYQLIEKNLAVLFKEYHERRKGRSLDEIDLEILTKPTPYQSQDRKAVPVSVGYSTCEHSFASRYFVESDSTATAASTAQTQGWQTALA